MLAACSDLLPGATVGRIDGDGDGRRCVSSMSQLPKLSVAKCDNLPRGFEQERVLATGNDLNDVESAQVKEMRREASHDTLAAELTVHPLTNSKQGLMQESKQQRGTAQFKILPDDERAGSLQRGLQLRSRLKMMTC